MEFDEEGKVTKDEFCSSYIGAMNFIEEAIYTTKDKIEDMKRLKQDYEKQFKQATQTEVKNKYGIMNESVLTIRVVQATDLMPMDYGGTSDPFCVLELEDQITETSVKQKTLNPVWDESFTFSIETGKEVLKVTVLDKDKLKEDDTEGTVDIPISDFASQISQDKWYDLQKPAHIQTGWKGKINLEIWWVH